jgi:hypothetical protein
MATKFPSEKKIKTGGHQIIQPGLQKDDLVATRSFHKNDLMTTKLSLLV